MDEHVPPAHLLAHEMFAIVRGLQSTTVVETSSYVLKLGETATFDLVGRLRVEPSAVEATLEEVRARMRERGRTRMAWIVSSIARPAGLAANLTALGLRPYDEPPWEPRLTAMLLEDEPPAGADGVVARRAGDLEEFTSGMEVLFDAHSVPQDARPSAPALEQRYEELHLTGLASLYVAYVDGRLVSVGSATFTPSGVALTGAGTLPGARGRGAYTALVRARWDAAVAAGTPALVIQAGAMSRPIAERVGFRALGPVDVLLDELPV